MDPKLLASGSDDAKGIILFNLCAEDLGSMYSFGRTEMCYFK